MNDENLEVVPQPENFEQGPVDPPVDDNVEVIVAADSVVAVAMEVVAGHWGRGNARKKKLAEAGWDPAEVQAEVDKILHRK